MVLLPVFHQAPLVVCLGGDADVQKHGPAEKACSLEDVFQGTASLALP